MLSQLPKLATAFTRVPWLEPAQPLPRWLSTVRLWLSLVLAGLLCAGDQNEHLRSPGYRAPIANLLALLAPQQPKVQLGLANLPRLYSQVLAKRQQSDAQNLKQIAQASNLGPGATIALCVGPLYCVDFNGDQPPREPASLIKVPIALILVKRLEETDTSLNTPIYLDPGNYTEDHSYIAVGQSHPLRYLMTEMLAESSNTATNQLIDFLGMDVINRELEAMGFSQTQVLSKLVGNYTYPDNHGGGPNRITSNELNRMMQMIYARKTTGYHAIRAALAKQYDDTMGITALSTVHLLNSQVVRWLGEKTGGTSRVLGTTFAFTLGDQACFLTLTTHNPGGERQIRQAIARVLKSL